MPLETGTYISDLVPANPLGSDPLAYADDHLRLIKSTLQNTFPNIKGSVTATQENLNNGTPVGLIAMWSGISIPAGWALCNGATVARSDGTGNVTTPDLRDRFLVGSGASYAVGATGGAASVTLSVAQLPSHTHSATSDVQGAHTHVVDDPGHAHSFTVIAQNTDSQGSSALTGGGVNSANDGQYSGTTGVSGTGIGLEAAGAHAHNISVGATGSGQAIENRPPYYALAFIMKV